MKQKTLSAAHRRNIAIGVTASMTLENRRARSVALTGRVLSEETKQRMSSAQRGRICSYPKTEKQIQAHRESGRRVAVNAALDGFPNLRVPKRFTENTRQKMRLAKLGTHRPPRSAESRAKMREAWKTSDKLRLGRITASETRRRNGPTEKMQAHLIRLAGRFGPSSLERTIAAVLESLGIQFIAQKRFGRFVVDFFVPSRNLVIECDGAHWHETPEAIERDRWRDAMLATLGLRVLRLLEHEIVSGEAVQILAKEIAA